MNGKQVQDFIPINSPINRELRQTVLFKSGTEFLITKREEKLTPHLPP